MNSNLSIPNSTDNPFVSLFVLLYSIEDQAALSNPGALATAIEQVGIWGWDRYGRFMHFPHGGDKAQEALDMIAEEYKEQTENQWYPVEAEPDDESLFFDHPAYAFGWAKAVLPEFTINPDAPKNPVARKGAETRTVPSLHKIIAALSYGLNFDISEGNKTRVSTVQDYLGQLSCPLDNNTVREHLKAASKLIPK